MNEQEPPIQCNNGFWDLEPEERAARMEKACQSGDVADFFDLPPEERAAAYEQE